MASASGGKVKQFMLGLMLLLVLLLGTISVAWAVWHVLSPHVNSTLITAVSTAIGSGLTLVLTRRWDKRWEIEQQHRAQKIPVYEEFIQFLFKVVLASKTEAEPVTEADMTKFIAAFVQKLIVWGSDECPIGFWKLPQDIGECRSGRT